MDDCDLEKLSVKPGVLKPKFHRSTTEYSVTVASDVGKLSVDYLTSDSNASCQILGGDGGRSVPLKEGTVTNIKLEVTAEDGTTKVYSISTKRLSAKDAVLKGFQVPCGQLNPAFSPDVLTYTCIVPYGVSTLKVNPTVPDKKNKISVNGQAAGSEIGLSVGETDIIIEVTSADGSTKQVYTLAVLKSWLGQAILFAEKSNQRKFECPFTLAPFYQPASIAESEPKHVFSEPILDEYTRTCKQDPLDGTPLIGDWKKPERQLNNNMSEATVECLYSYKGCSEKIKYRELGPCIKSCSLRPKFDEETLDTVNCKACSRKIFKTDEECHNTYLCTSKFTKRDVKHTVKEHAWQKKLQETGLSGSKDQLVQKAKEFIKKYKGMLPRKGQNMKYPHGETPYDILHNAAVNLAGAIKENPKDADLHFQLGLVLEEQYHLQDLYGVKPEDEDDNTHGLKNLTLNPTAKETSKEDDIQAICEQRGAGSNAPLARQLQAIDEEYRYLLDSGQSQKADYVQGLYIWKSKQAMQDGKAAQAAEDHANPLGQACLKYLDALSLDQNNVTYNLQVGRLFLLQGKSADAIERFQVAVGLKPIMPLARLYLGLSLASQDKGPETRTKETINYLHYGLQYLLEQCTKRAEEEIDKGDSFDLNSEDMWRLTNSHLLRAAIQLGNLLRKSQPDGFMKPKQVYHSAALLAAQTICSIVHRGDTMQSMEWILLDAHTNLLEILMIEEPGNAEWIARRCQYLSAVINASSIPQSNQVLELQKQTCQKGVMAQSTNSHALYLLGMSQLNMYENSPTTEGGKKALEDARLSFRASIAQEGKASIGGTVPEQLTKQAWWQDKIKKEKEANEKKAAAEKMAAGGKAAPTARGGATVRGRGGVAARGAPTARTPAARGSSKTPAPAARGAARGIARGAATSRGAKTPMRGGASSARGGSNTKVAASKPAAAGSPPPKETNDNDTKPKEKAKESPVPANAPINKMTYPPRFGLARALSKETEDFTEAQMLYNDVITMAPQVHDAYIELGDLLVKSEPLKAIEVYAKFPFTDESSFDDAYLHGEIVRLLMKHEQFDDPKLEKHMIAWGKVMGIGCLEKYVEILDAKFKSKLLMNVYAGVNKKSVDDPDMQAFFKFKMWSS